MSGPNDNFTRYISRFNDDIESGSGPYKDMKWTDIFASSRTRWNNMVASGQDKLVNPNDAKLLALSTQVKELKQALADQNSTKPTAAATKQKKLATGREVFPGHHAIENGVEQKRATSRW